MSLKHFKNQTDGLLINKKMVFKLYLLYSYENISSYLHNDIIPLKLDQTEFFESEAFRMLNESNLVQSDYIGFISPFVLETEMKKEKSLDEYICKIKPTHTKS